jgi:hypothetical protein
MVMLPCTAKKPGQLPPPSMVIPLPPSIVTVFPLVRFKRGSRFCKLMVVEEPKEKTTL